MARTILPTWGGLSPMSRAIARLLRPSRRIRAILRFRSKTFLCRAITPSRERRRCSWGSRRPGPAGRRTG